jgi:hypothetical protein
MWPPLPSPRPPRSGNLRLPDSMKSEVDIFSGSRCGITPKSSWAQTRARAPRSCRGATAECRRTGSPLRSTADHRRRCLKESLSISLPSIVARTSRARPIHSSTWVLSVSVAVSAAPSQLAPHEQSRSQMPGLSTSRCGMVQNDESMISS